MTIEPYEAEHISTLKAEYLLDGEIHTIERQFCQIEARVEPESLVKFLRKFALELEERISPSTSTHP